MYVNSQAAWGSECVQCLSPISWQGLNGYMYVLYVLHSRVFQKILGFPNKVYMPFLTVRLWNKHLRDDKLIHYITQRGNYRQETPRTWGNSFQHPHIRTTNLRLRFLHHLFENDQQGIICAVFQTDSYFNLANRMKRRMLGRTGVFHVVDTLPDKVWHRGVLSLAQAGQTAAKDLIWDTKSGWK